MQVRPEIELANLTDVGCEREINEDYYCYWEPESEEQYSHKGRLMVIADGMGGYEGGEAASRLAVDAVRETYTRAAGDPQDALLAGFKDAHAMIRQYVRAKPELEGMGTTCTAVALTGGNLYFAHVGDSRLYLVRNSTIVRLTKDHSYVSRLVDEGILTPAEAERHPENHVLTAALGADSEVKVDIPETPLHLQPGDTLLLCTDGLWGLVSDEELLARVERNPLSEACRELIRLAKARGGPDNITVQIVRVGLNAASVSATGAVIT